jgi:CheY-like chemotaxis protein
MKNTVLVIEDNPLNLELVRDILEVNDYGVLCATTAEEGLRLAREHLPDLVIMDLSLPGMDGLAATKALRADSATSHLIIIALTAHAMRGDRDVAITAGCDGYLTKPIETSTFAPRIAWFISARKAFQR